MSNQLYFKPPDKAVILSEALRRPVANRGLYSAESKDPGDAYPTHAVRAFSTTEAPTWRAQVRTAGRILFSGFGGRKAPNGMGEISTLEVLRLRAIKRFVTR
jgi:putative SOS response-associated peptidase YedK